MKLSIRIQGFTIFYFLVYYWPEYGCQKWDWFSPIRQFDSDSNHSLTQKERFYLNAFFIESRAQGNIYLPRSLDLFILILDVVKLA